MQLKRVISGGQTGVDQIGIKVARRLGIPTGGTAPKGWRTEDGPRPSLAEFGLVESFSPDYATRTAENAYDSDGTVIFADDLDTPGTKCTIKALKRHYKPYVVNPNVEQLVEFLNKHKISILNVAGNRGSKLKDERRFQIGMILFESLKKFNNI